MGGGIAVGLGLAVDVGESTGEFLGADHAHGSIVALVGDSRQVRQALFTGSSSAAGLNGRMHRYAAWGLALAYGLVGLTAAACTTESGDGVKTTTASASPSRKASPKPSAGSGSPTGAAVKKYGPSSPQCLAAQKVMEGAARVGLRGAVGKVTGDDLANTWTEAVAKDLPPGAAALSEDVRVLAEGLVGKDSADAKPQLAAYTGALERLTAMATTMCLAPPPPPKPTVKPSGKSTAKPSGSASASPSK